MASGLNNHFLESPYMYPIPGKFQQYIHRLREAPVEYTTSSYDEYIERINALEEIYASQSDEQLREHIETFRQQAQQGISLDDLLFDVFAIVREAAKRTLAMRPFDVQLLAGIVLHQGNVAEMQTGEGKTLAAVMPACLHALEGKGVQILTFNDYLAQRDADWMGEIYRFLGFSVGAVEKHMSTSERQQAWRQDITYATAKEAGFDFLRDRLVLAPQDAVHRPFHYAIVDEADSILIDEARVPLVIAGTKEKQHIDPYKLAQIVKELTRNEHYKTDEFQRTLFLTDEGQDTLEERLSCGPLHAPENHALLTGLQVALHALVLLKKDVDYIVKHGKIELIDEFTGRVVDDRQWPDGIQAALEAKEGLELQPEGEVLGSISLQHLMRQYTHLAGMTGTARPAEDEFHTFYGLRVVVIPTNTPCIRRDEEDILFLNVDAKHKALVQTIRTSRAQQRPVLVGTASVEESETISALLREAEIPHEVLNARTDALEAQIIAQAGLPGAITISTNMAGRGVDIKLGGHDEAKRDAVVSAGGLYVIGTNRHESVRIDYQLRGRAGRQGDPGSSCFFVSLEDELMARFEVKALIPKRLLPTSQDAPLDNPIFRREVARTQRIIEGQNFTIRQTLFKYSSFIEQQRETIHTYRADILNGEEGVLILKEAMPSLFRELSALMSEEALAELARKVVLIHLDTCWAQHLAHLTDIREGIHLQSAAGPPPFFFFCRQAVEAFEDIYQRIEDKTVETFTSSEIKDGRFILNEDGMQRPTSTWTYLINDESFDRGIAALFHSGGSAFAAYGSFLLIPLAFAWSIWQKISKKR
tara:strand:- start:7029 stop:9476 length:2448 start_codon:yes stop_codon:yes gene_type:complete